MRFAVLIALIVAPFAAYGEDLKHDWKQQKAGDVLMLISNHRAPASVSPGREPEATLTMEIKKAPANVTLPDLVKGEVGGIRSTLKLGDQPEENGHKPVDGIISYVENIDGQDVGFIKYQVTGTRDKTLPHPRSVTHAMLMKQGKLCFVHLIVLYPGHLDEVTGDQMRMVKSFIAK